MAKLKINNKNLKLNTSSLAFGSIIMVFKMTTAQHILSIPLTKSYAYIATIDWGDGSQTKIDESYYPTNDPIEHTYSFDVTTSFIVTIKTKLWENLSITRTELTDILSFGHNDLTKYKLINFDGSSNLVNIPNEIQPFLLVTNGNISKAFVGTPFEGIFPDYYYN